MAHSLGKIPLLAIILAFSIGSGCTIRMGFEYWSYYPTNLTQKRTLINKDYVVPSFSRGGAFTKEEIIFNLIEGRSVDDALAILAESGFKCEIMICYWADAMYAHENPTRGLRVAILIANFEGADRVSKDNVQIITKIVRMSMRDPWLKTD